jgi:DNA-binding MarR family transcriptional regulator
MARKLSETQMAALRALEQLSVHGAPWAARDIAARAGQSTDGAAYTLRSLRNRGLVTVGHGDGDCYGYRITEAGRDEVARDNERETAERAALDAFLAGRFPEKT